MLSDSVQRTMIENDWREADRHLVTVLLDDPHDADCGCHRCATVAALSDRLNNDASARRTTAPRPPSSTHDIPPPLRGPRLRLV